MCNKLPYPFSPISTHHKLSSPPHLFLHILTYAPIYFPIIISQSFLINWFIFCIIPLAYLLYFVLCPPGKLFTSPHLFSKPIKTNNLPSFHHPPLVFVSFVVSCQVVFIRSDYSVVIEYGSLCCLIMMWSWNSRLIISKRHALALWTSRSSIWWCA